MKEKSDVKGIAFAALFLAFVLAACATTTRPGQVGVERQQLLLVSSKDVNAAAEKAYRNTLQKAAEKNNLLESGPELTRVKQIAERLIPVTAVFREEAPRWKWEVGVIDGPDLNAWCMPGGKIAVYTGLIEKLEITDDELAAVMGHEIAHALREHGREKASRAQITSLGLNILSLVTGMGAVASDLAGTVAHVTMNLPNSREAEVEADRMGVELAARAGFNPKAAIDLWRKMEKQASGKPPEWLSTHPSGQNRIADLTEYAELVYPLYEEVMKSHPKPISSPSQSKVTASPSQGKSSMQ